MDIPETPSDIAERKAMETLQLAALLYVIWIGISLISRTIYRVIRWIWVTIRSK